MMHDPIVRCGSLTLTTARTPRRFRWGMRSDLHVLLSVSETAHAKGHAPPKMSGVLLLVSWFCVASTWMDTLPAGNREDGKASRKMARRTTLRCQREYHGISAALFTGLAGYSWNQAQQATQNQFLTGAMPVPESDSGVHEKRYCCAGGERPHKRPAKLAASPRKAGGSTRLRRAVFVKDLAKARSAHQRADRDNT